MRLVAGFDHEVLDVGALSEAPTSGVARAARAPGDFQTLAEHSRRAQHVHLGPDVAAGPGTLTAAIETALS